MRKISIVQPSDDFIEWFLAVLFSATSCMMWSRKHDSWALFFLFLTVLASARIVTEAIGRVQLRNRVQYETIHGLLIVGDRVPPPEYVEAVIDETFEWMVEHAKFSKEELEQSLDGCVFEVLGKDRQDVECSLGCSWPLLPWETGTWLQGHLDEKGRLRSLPHALFHRAMYKKYGMTSVDEIHASAEDVGFDKVG